MKHISFLLLISYLTQLNLINSKQNYQYPITYHKTNKILHHNGNLMTLTQLNVRCPYNSALIDFNLNLYLDTHYYYEYKCLPVSVINNVITLFTPINRIQKGSERLFKSANFLDRHFVKCPDNYALQGFNLRDGAEFYPRKLTSSTVFYEYACIFSNILKNCSSGTTIETKGGGNENWTRSTYLSFQN